MVIQWFPGHMTKARRQITESLKLVDAVCEIVDARIPLSSRNPDIDSLTGAKPRLVVLNRVDQADPEMNKKWAAYLSASGVAVIETDSKSGSGTKQFPAAARELLQEKLAVLRDKGQEGKALRLIVVGIPNVGKSSFINRVAGRKAARVSDRPGVTRGQQWIKLDAGIEMIDTPGVLWPKFEDKTVAENLAFTGAIRDQVMDVETLGIRLMHRLALHYPERIKERYKIDIEGVNLKSLDSDDNDDTDDTYDTRIIEAGYELLARAAKRRGFLASGGECDTERMAVILLDEFRGSKLGRLTLEQPPQPIGG